MLVQAAVDPPRAFTDQTHDEDLNKPVEPGLKRTVSFAVMVQQK